MQTSVTWNLVGYRQVDCVVQEVLKFAGDGRVCQPHRMLDVDQLIELEVLAREELDRLKAEAAKEEVDPAAVAVDVAIGRLSRLDSMQMEEVRKDATRRRNERIHLLQQAVKKMDEGSYGLCQGCNEWISYARLAESPEAILCGNCAT